MVSFPIPATNGKRQIVQARIPTGYSAKPEPATYRIHFDAPQGLPVGPSGWPGLRIYAVAAGPRAVGSVAIDLVSFGPPIDISVSARDFTVFGFHARSDFDSVTAEFQLVAPYQGRNLVSTEESMGINPVSEDEHVSGLHWQPRAARSGDHMLRIVAWRGVNKGADWVSAFSSDLVSVQK